MECSRSNCNTSLLSDAVGLGHLVRPVLLPLELAKQVLATLVLVLAKLHQMDLIRAVDNAHRPAVRPHVRQRRVLADTCATVRLDCTVDHLERHAGHLHLCFGDFLEGELGVFAVDHEGCVQHCQTRCVDLYARAGDALQHDAVLVQLLAEGSLARVVDAGQEVLESLLGGADGAHGVVDAAGSKAALDDFEAAALAEDHVGGGHADVVEGDVAVTVRGVVEAVHAQHAVDGDAGGLGGDEDDGLLLVDRGVFGVALAHDDVDLAARVTGTGRPPLGAVQDPVVTLLAHGQGDVGGVRAGDVGLGHQEGGSDLALEQWLEPLVLVLLCAVLGEHLHVACVGGGAVGGLGCGQALAQVLCHQAVFQVGEAGALLEVVLGQEHVPQAKGPGLLLQLFHDRRVGAEAVDDALANLLAYEGVGGDTFFFDESLDLVGNVSAC